jgi:hypothetical protein
MIDTFVPPTYIYDSMLGCKCMCGLLGKYIGGWSRDDDRPIEVFFAEFVFADDMSE